MSGNAIGALVAKDLRLFFRNRFFAFVTVLGLVFYVIVYWAMPPAVDELLRLGLLVPPSLQALLVAGEEAEGVEMHFMASDAELQQAVVSTDVLGGIAFPDDTAELLRAGWGEVWGHLATLAGINALLYALGIAALKRRLA